MRTDKIPIDDQIRDFKNHLTYNERIIFSAKFGDGKTFFLEEFFSKNKDYFEVIQIFPINYQVAKNEDIFELVKKDILIHLLANDLIANKEIVTNSTFARYYLFNNGADIMLDLLSAVPGINNPVEMIQKAISHFKNFKTEKEKAQKGRTRVVEEYIEEFKHEKGVSENDSYSELIIKCINELKINNKEVVLLVEDLDRLDPAHLFRILNILTAHIDKDSSLDQTKYLNCFNNKFNFDKIITVFDYNNTKHIFHHFYGEKTSYEGYIDKFTTSAPFFYSIKEVAKNYCFKTISKLTSIPADTLKKTHHFKSNIDLLSVRRILHLITSPEKQIINEIYVTKKGIRINTINPFTIFLVFLYRLGLSFSSHIAKHFFGHDRIALIETIGVCWFMQNSLKTDLNSLIIPKSSNSMIGMLIDFKLVGDGNSFSKMKIKRDDTNVVYQMLIEAISEIEVVSMKYVKK